MLSCLDCKRFVRENEPACPFCGAARATAFAPVVRTMMLGVALAACGPSVGSGDDGGSTSGNDTHATVDDGPGTSPNPTTAGTSPDPTSATTVDPDPSTDTTASTTSTDDNVVDDEGCAFYGGCPFDVSGLDLECDIWAQDCPDGEKCMPWANDGGQHWNATRCSPLDPTPGAPGDPCTAEGSGVSGIDDCAISAMCWNVDPATNQGTCVAFCSGSEASPLCPDDPSTQCMMEFGGVINLCLPACDPRLQDCSAFATCAPAGEAFFCLPDNSGAEGQYGDGCMFIDACDPGLFCANPAAFPECDDVACCAEFCDLALPDPNTQCTNADQGVQCVPWFEDGGAPPGWETIGACIVPA